MMLLSASILKKGSNKTKLTCPRVGFYSPDEKWHLRNVSSDLFQWPLTGVAQVPLFDLVAFFEFYSGCCEGGWGQGGEAGEIVLLSF